MVAGKNKQRLVENYNESPLKKIDWSIISFIICHLYFNPNEKRTTLSMKTGLSYSRFMRYIKWLLFVDWIEIVDGAGFVGLKLTDTGMAIHDKIRSDNICDDQGNPREE